MGHACGHVGSYDLFSINDCLQMQPPQKDGIIKDDANKLNAHHVDSTASV